MQKNMDKVSDMKDKMEKKNEKKPLVEITENKNNDSSFKQKLTSVICAVMVTVMIAASATCVPLLERKIPDFQLNTMRCGLATISFALYFVFKQEWPKVSRSEFVSVGVVVVGETLLPLFMYIAVSLVPLTYFKSLYISCNLIFGLLLYPIILKEGTTFKKVFMALVCICGVFLSIQPDFIFTWKKHDHLISNSSNITMEEMKSAYHVTQGMTILGCVLASLVGLIGCTNVIGIKLSPLSSKNVCLIPFWSGVFGTAFSLAVMFIFEHPVLPTTWEQILLISIHCSTAVTVNPLVVMASSHIPGELVNIVLSTLVVTMLLPQYTLLKHILPGNHNWIEVLGSFLVFFGATIGSCMELAIRSKE